MSSLLRHVAVGNRTMALNNSQTKVVVFLIVLAKVGLEALRIVFFVLLDLVLGH